MIIFGILAIGLMFTSLIASPEGDAPASASQVTFALLAVIAAIVALGLEGQ